MPEKSIIRSDLDQKKLEKFGPIDNNSEALADRDFITTEGSKHAMEILSKRVIDRAVKKWGLVD